MRGCFCPSYSPPRPRAPEKAPSENAWCFFVTSKFPPRPQKASEKNTPSGKCVVFFCPLRFPTTSARQASGKIASRKIVCSFLRKRPPILVSHQSGQPNSETPTPASPPISHHVRARTSGKTASRKIVCSCEKMGGSVLIARGGRVAKPRYRRPPENAWCFFVTSKFPPRPRKASEKKLRLEDAWCFFAPSDFPPRPRAGIWKNRVAKNRVLV